MEKSGRIQLTTVEFAEITNLHCCPQSVTSKWGIKTYKEVQGMISSNNYEIIGDMLPLTYDEIPL
jgi:hypothetical protein